MFNKPGTEKMDDPKNAPKDNLDKLAEGGQKATAAKEVKDGKRTGDLLAADKEAAGKRASASSDGKKADLPPTIGSTVNKRYDPLPINSTVHESWKIISRMGRFHDSCVFQAFNENCNLNAVLRISKASYKRNTVTVEAYILKLLNGKSVHCPQYYGSCIIGDMVTVLVEPTGVSLHRLREQMPSRSFSKHTVSKISAQCIEALQDLHRIGLTHRRVAPTAFSMGIWNSTNRDIVMLADLGYARPFRYSSGGHFNFRGVVGYLGNSHYGSMNVHKKMDLSRRDDMWSLFYVILEMAFGDLPWRSAAAEPAVALMKQKHNLSGLCVNCKELMPYAKHVESLEFVDEPDYTLLSNTLNSWLDKNCPAKHPYVGVEWENENEDIIDEQYYYALCR